jgi:hypothetical protein
MLDIAVTSRIARDLSAQQFSAPTPRAQQVAPPAAPAPRAPVRRSAVRVLRRLADRLEPAPRAVRA